MNKQQQYYKQILEAVRSKSTCNKKKIAAILVRDKSILCSGYAGAPRGLPHCDDLDHLVDSESLNSTKCIRTLHSELNVILTAARNNINIEGCDIYCTHKPCYNCMKMLINSGIKNCYYFEDYQDKFQQHFEKNDYCQFIKIKEE